MISILIPTYNQECVALVKEMHRQAIALHIYFEILIADDASSDLTVRMKNRVIEQISFCSYIQLSGNIGPARIRNLLVERAKYPFVLLMDADTFPYHADFLKNYLDCAKESLVVCGGFIYERTSHPPMCWLRYYYGIRVEESSAQERNLSPYNKFISMCFFADKEVFRLVRFDEKMHFGYEDTFFGIQLKEAGVPVLHIDNPVFHQTTDKTDDYLRKIRKSIRNIVPRLDLLHQHIRLLKWYGVVRRIGLERVIRFLFTIGEPLIVRNLSGKHPSMHLFAFYKLGYLCTCLADKAKKVEN